MKPAVPVLLFALLAATQVPLLGQDPAPCPPEYPGHRGQAVELLESGAHGFLATFDPATLVVLTESQTCKALNFELKLNYSIIGGNADYNRSYFTIGGWYVAVLSWNPDKGLKQAPTVVVVFDSDITQSGIPASTFLMN